MPQTSASFSQSLGIRLDGSQSSYAPGDTIIGCVYRRTPTVSPEAVVSISLCGRTKTKLVEHRNNNQANSTYRGRFNIIPEDAYTQKIFQGPLHIEEFGNEQAWPFAITLPEYVDPKYVQGQDQKASFLPLNKADHVLPSTFTLDTNGSTEAFVEYFLKATVRLTGQGKTKWPEAILPFKVRNLSLDPPRADFGLKGSKSWKYVTSYRLIPGMEEAKLSFSQKMKQSFSTSSVPEFQFHLLVDVPTVIQLDNPNPIPFRLKAVPDWTKTSEVLKDIPQQLKLTWVDIRIAINTEVKCEGTWSSHEKLKREEVNLSVMSALFRPMQSLYIPCSDEAPPLDIGKLIDLRLGYLAPGNGPSGYRFTPSFTTYNIHHSHKLNWAIKGSVAGDHFGATGTVGLTLLMPSDERGYTDQQDPEIGGEAGGESEAGPSRLQRNESWIQPPDEDDAPPSFTEVMKEDGKAAMPEKCSN
ncbi:hypothetical protein FHETE_6037 [Fusarium heterosporum]|uniref:Arrestin-like N-terminal domain-containing protein n=1 Tax=Fusarium heterosporum TaxID=42747 RepID=A0A8H5TDX9_FUSHE|nr:hypothetical protein FHETE_6037 [Fusarium heterosporum]